ncbi:MAG: alkaline phosphatase, partial [Bacteroidales bacterium]|nr:alkaline phosphatase [Bacteroidales bacterium]
MKNKFYSMVLGAALLLCAACGGTNSEKAQSNGAAANGKAPKYIFYFVGDGMSQPQITMAEKAISEPGFREQFNKQTCNIYNHDGGALNLRQFPSVGLATTNAENRFITCSAAAATALATGNKTTINTISMNGDRTANLETIAEKAKKAGMKVGVVTSVSIDHATPACFYAHVEDRNMYESIGHWLLKSNFDYFGGGFTRWDKYKDMTKDQFIDSLKIKGYTVTTTRKDFDALNAQSGKVLATINKVTNEKTDGSALPYNIDLDIQQSDDDRIVLRDFVKKGIELLYNEDKGFFLFTEGGKIDWADHANDAVSNIYETLALDAAIGVAMDFYKQHPDETLIVFTGDHECGGLTLGFAGTNYESAFQLMQNQVVSFETFGQEMREYIKTNPKFDALLAKLQENFGIGGDGALKLSEYETKRLKDAYLFAKGDKSVKLTDEEKHLFYGGYEPITVTTTHIIDNKAGVEWASYSHTALPVPVYSMGCGSEQLEGYFDNTDIPNTMMRLAN